LSINTLSQKILSRKYFIINDRFYIKSLISYYDTIIKLKTTKDKKMINKKLLLSIAATAIIYTGCNEKETTPKDTPVTKNETETTVDKIANSVITNLESTAKETEKLSKDIQTSAAPVVKDISNKVKVVQKNISETSKDVKTKITKVSAPIIETVKQAVTTPDANILYKKCAGCHGLSAEKKALNKSAIIKDWDATQIAEALKGYKAGTYGGVMKGVMKSQVATLSDKDINTLSQHISNFK
jgi:cytochrome c553